MLLAEFPPLLQATIPPPRRTNRTIRLNIVFHPRRRSGVAKNKKQANTAPPPTDHRPPGRAGYLKPEVAPAAEAVNVAVPAEVPEIFTGDVEPKLNVGIFCAPVGLEAIVAMSATFPVNPPDGVIVTVPEALDPRLTVIVPPVIVKPGAAVTVTGAVPVLGA